MSRQVRSALDACFDEAVALAERARGYFEGPARSWRAGLTIDDQARVAIESLAVTARLMAAMAWLLSREHAGNGRPGAAAPLQLRHFSYDIEPPLVPRPPFLGTPLVAIAQHSRDLVMRVLALARRAFAPATRAGTAPAATTAETVERPVVVVTTRSRGAARPITLPAPAAPTPIVSPPAAPAAADPAAPDSPDPARSVEKSPATKTDRFEARVNAVTLPDFKRPAARAARRAKRRVANTEAVGDGAAAASPPAADSAGSVAAPPPVDPRASGNSPAPPPRASGAPSGFATEAPPIATEAAAAEPQPAPEPPPQAPSLEPPPIDPPRLAAAPPPVAAEPPVAPEASPELPPLEAPPVDPPVTDAAPPPVAADTPVEPPATAPPVIPPLIDRRPAAPPAEIAPAPEDAVDSLKAAIAARPELKGLWR